MDVSMNAHNRLTVSTCVNVCPFAYIDEPRKHHLHVTLNSVIDALHLKGVFLLFNTRTHKKAHENNSIHLTEKKINNHSATTINIFIELNTHDECGKCGTDKPITPKMTSSPINLKHSKSSTKQKNSNKKIIIILYGKPFASWMSS